MRKLNHNHQRAVESKENPDTQKDASIAAKASIIVFSKAIGILARISSIMVLTRLLAKDDFGLLSFVLLAYTTVTGLSQLGLPDSVFYFFERIPKESRKSFALLTGKVLFFIGLGCSTILIILTFVAPLLGYPVGGLFIPLIFLAILELPTTPIPNILIAINRAKQAAWFNIFNSAMLFCATVLPAVLGQPLSAIVYSLAGYGVLRFILSAFVFFKNFPGAGGDLPEGMIRTQLQYSVPLGIAQVMWKVNTVIDKFVVMAFLPVAVFAEYTVGAWEFPLLPTIAYSVAAVMMPQFVACHLKGEKEELLRLWFRSIEKVSIIVLPFMVLFLLVAEEFVVVLFSEQYINAALPFRIYTLVLFQRVTSYSSILKALGETKAITRQAVYIVLINLVLSIPFVMMWGMAGPPLATLIASIITWFYFLIKIKDAIGVRFKEVFPFKFYTKALGVSFAAGVPVLLLAQWLQTSFEMSLIWKITAYLLSFAVLSTITGVCKKEDWLFLGKVIGLKSILDKIN